MEAILIHKTSIQLLTLENTFSSLPVCHSARRACPELQNPLSHLAKDNLLPREKVTFRADEGWGKVLFPVTHRQRRSPQLPDGEG